MTTGPQPGGIVAFDRDGVSDFTGGNERMGVCSRPVTAVAEAMAVSGAQDPREQGHPEWAVAGAHEHRPCVRASPCPGRRSGTAQTTVPNAKEGGRLRLSGHGHSAGGVGRLPIVIETEDPGSSTVPADGLCLLTRPTLLQSTTLPTPPGT